MFVRKKSINPASYRASSDLVPLVLAGSRAAIARMISRAEGEYDEAAGALAQLYRHAGRAHVVGITGVPGGGKSTLISALIRACSTGDNKVAIVAVDPSSPYSGGAILGDRIRMSDSAEASQAFVRSMATRGHLGGLARATFQAVDILDAAGYSPIFIETVGVGQDEVEIMTAAHTVVVLSPPGLGDDIQAIKAGVMEIADIHAVSKSDRPEAAATATAIRGMLALGSETQRSSWAPPVLTLSAPSGAGIDALKQAIDSHLLHLMESGEMVTRRRAIARTRILATINHLIRRRFDDGAETMATQLAAVTQRTSDPSTAAEWLLGLNRADLA
ncbi:MAG: methylmalonyl Co-A mutase-associated GTPase MeaB [Hoeflea sp.]|nr:methylmalonyl Co-A mutase-associated GTPase MeaB [Hoeflea sp.]